RSSRLFYRAQIPLTRGGRRVGRAHREGLPLRPRATRLRVRPAVLSRCRSVAEIEYEEGAEPVARANAGSWHVGCGAALGARWRRGSSVTLCGLCLAG